MVGFIGLGQFSHAVKKHTKRKMKTTLKIRHIILMINYNITEYNFSHVIGSHA